MKFARACDGALVLPLCPSKRTMSDSPPRFRHVGLVRRGDYLLPNISGEILQTLSKLLTPGAEESRKTLIDLRQDLRLTRPQLAAALGTTGELVKHWEVGTRKPNGPARKLIAIANSVLRADRDFGLMDMAFNRDVSGNSRALAMAAQEAALNSSDS